MKRSTYLLLAAIPALAAVLFALDAVNLETDRMDRWAMIFSVAGAVFFLALATADVSSSTDDAGSGTPSPRGRSGAMASSARPSSLPSRPVGPRGRSSDDVDIEDFPPLPARLGSLFTEPTDDGEATSIPERIEPQAVEPQSSDLVALPSDPLADLVDDEQIELADDEQIEEITALVEAAEQEAPTGIDAEAEPAVSTELEPSLDPDTPQPLARLDLRLADYDDEALRRVVKESEALVIAEMVRTGQLTSEGELTERDIASMVFLSYTSEEMLDELRLRKALDIQDDQPGDVAVTERALAPLKNME